MILADTSIWIDHLRAGETGLVSLLNDNQVLTHPMAIVQLACGNLHNRDAVLGLLGGLPAITAATDEEVLFFIKERRMMGLGIGYIDAHLLAAATLARSVQLWTRNGRLEGVAADLDLAYEMPRAR